MYQDSALTLSLAQAVTSAAGSTDYYDQGVAGGRDLGTGEPLYVVVVVATALTDGGTNAGTVVALEGDSSTSFTPDGTRNLFTFAQAEAAGVVKYARLQPGGAPEAFRYLRLKFTPTTADLTGGTFTAFITSDIQKYVSYAKGYTIS